MTRDLEETLNELGPGYREVVDRLTGAYKPLTHRSDGDVASPSGRSSEKCAKRPGHLFRWTFGYLVAASLLVFLGLGVVFQLDSYRSDGDVASPSGHLSAECAFSRGRISAKGAEYRVYTVAYAADEAALQAIVASQRADGSWANDFITRQNAAALRGAADAVSLVAYKRALRYLRSRGLEPLTESELKARADRAARAQMS